MKTPGENIKKVIVKLAQYIILGLLMMVLYCVPCRAEEEKTNVKAAVYNYTNFLMKTEDYVEGYAYRYLSDICSYTGWDIEYISMPRAEAVKALARGEIDIIAGGRYTEAEEGLFNYSARDMGEGGAVLCTMPDNKEYSFNDYETYRGTV